ncbi:MAG TPA: hypothetical protein PLD82_05275, partial [Spirochaetota bacterium]|nr:hypothetical protein [Spirochaetota bacterium]
PRPIQGRLVVNDIEDFIRNEKIDFDRPEDCFRLQARFCGECGESCSILQALQKFVHVIPRLPEVAGKRTVPVPAIDLSTEMDRETILRILGENRSVNETVDLAFHAARLPGDWFEPYWHAAFRRNPVSLELSSSLGDLEAVVAELRSMDESSIYEEERIAQPDEVWNFRTGDGFEKAVSLVNIALARGEGPLVLRVEGEMVRVLLGERTWDFATGKTLSRGEWRFG